MASENNDVEEVDGCILSIRVRNFFCHENLVINLNKNVNFIVGRNGSGKSAILTALVVGLGGRASVTNRGNNLHAFIKKGSNSATIEIKIKNSTSKAYKPTIYGDHITIVRTLNASGGSGYKVKSASGEIISTKFEEVHNIVLAHDIQVDNPISILNQDDARSFHSSDAKKKFSMFRKATNFDLIESNYNKAMENCKKAISVWKRKVDASRVLVEDYKKWKTLYTQMQSQKDIEEKEKALQNESRWSEVVSLESDLADAQELHKKYKVNVEKLTNRIKSMQAERSCGSDTINEKKSELQSMTQEKLSLERQCDSLEEDLRIARNSYRTVQADASTLSEKMDRERRKIANLKKEIESSGGDSRETARAALERRRERAAAQLAAVNARANTAKNDAHQAQANAQHAAGLAERASVTTRMQRDKLRQVGVQMRELEARGGDSLAVFGGNVVELCQRVRAAAAQFSAPPRGPVGAYLKVKDKKWGGTLEHILGGAIHSFCVNTPEDSRKLFEIMGKVYGHSAKPSVTCSKFLERRHDVRARRVAARGHVCALDALDVQDAVVANYLIDNLGLETVLLVPDHDEAISLSDTVENVPRNCSKIVTLDCTEYHPAPSYRSYGGAARPARYLHQTTADRKRQLQHEMTELESALKSAEAAESAACDEAREAREAERTAAKALQALLGERHRAEEALREAELALQQQAPQQSVLIKELEDLTQRYEKFNDEHKKLSTKEEQCRSKLAESEEAVAELRKKMAHISTTCRTLSEKIEREQMRLDEGASERHRYQCRLKEEQAKLGEAAAALDAKARELREATERAQQQGQRVDRPRDQSVVQNELNKVQMKLKSSRNAGLSKEEVTTHYEEARDKYERIQSLLQGLEMLIKNIETTTEQHRVICEKMQKCIARKVAHSFQSILAVRGYSGRMEIDLEARTVEVWCSGRDAARAAASTSSLSGGERSYSTVAFIMALWECVELPFFFMDEFDVFMDNVNRKVVMQLLVEHALERRSRQFAFLTPQDTSSVKASQHLTIHVMPDPRP